MCFDIHHSHSTAKKATENIICYKRLEVYLGAFHPEKITRGNVYKMRFITPYCRQRIHLDKKPLKKSRLDVGFNSIERGLHSYSESRKALSRCNSDEVVVKCFIPKGSIYYFNPVDKEYVSNQLQYTDKFVVKACQNLFSIKISDKKLIYEEVLL